MMADSSQKVSDSIVKEVQKMIRVDQNQIQVMANGDIVLNTEGHGVMYFKQSKLSLEDGVLRLADLQSLDDQNSEGYSSTCLFSDEYRENLTIVSYSAKEQKIKLSKRDPW